MGTESYANQGVRGLALSPAGLRQLRNAVAAASASPMAASGAVGVDQTAPERPERPERRQDSIMALLAPVIAESWPDDLDGQTKAWRLAATIVGIIGHRLGDARTPKA